MCYGLNRMSPQDAYFETLTLILWFGQVEALKGKQVIIVVLSQIELALRIKGEVVRTRSPPTPIIKTW